MSRTKRDDLIRVVEASYDLDAGETDWLQGIADGVQSVLQAEEAVLVYHFEILDGGGYRIRTPVTSGDSSIDVEGRIRAMGALMERKRTGQLGLLERAKCHVYERVIRAGIDEPAWKLVHSEYRRIGPEWMYTLGAPIADTFALMCHHVDGLGVTGVFGGLKKKRRFVPAQRQMYQMLSAHIKAGYRLRQRLPQGARSVSAPGGGAVLDADARVVHAEGEATHRDARAELAEAAKRVDRARSRRLGRGREALDIWQGLVDGTWSLVERFDSDGKRFMLAHRNPEDVTDPRGLTTMETRVVALTVRGYSDKLTAYHLGISTSTVSAHLSSAMTKLAVDSRVELVRHLGRFYPRREVRV